MTITSWVVFVLMSLSIGFIAICVFFVVESDLAKFLCIFIAVVLVIGTFCGFRWYHSSTASGRRELISQKSELANGLDRIVNVYTANGDIIATYEGKIDLEDNDGGYVMFDFEGKRYMYYNCFVESIADII